MIACSMSVLGLGRKAKRIETMRDATGSQQHQRDLKPKASSRSEANSVAAN
jgi:hypothetical protein